MTVATPSSITITKGLKSPAESKITSPLRNLFSPTSTYFVNKKEEAELLGSQDFCQNNLLPNGLQISDGQIDEESWTRLAFSLGIALRQDAKQTSEIARFSYQMRKRKRPTDVQMFEQLSSLIKPLASPLSLSQQGTSKFFSDAVPTREELRHSVRRLPCPAPCISIGYQPSAFDTIDEELQKGIIADQSGFPVDLGRISQPTKDHFWPFLIVEVSEHSMLAAKHACAIAAASCNNAVRLLAHAAGIDKGLPLSNPFSTETNTRHCFSLAVSGKIACLHVHGSETNGTHTTQTIQTYNLEEDTEVCSLTQRLRSILVWGRFSRLPEIMEKLESLDRKVNGNTRATYILSYADDEFDPAIFKTLDLRASKNRRKKVAAQVGLPGWIRHGGLMTG